MLGIDPGTARLGYAVVDSDSKESCHLVVCGIIETSKNQTAAQRLSEIRRDLTVLFDTYSPDFVSVEELFFFKNLKTIIPVAQARGVILELSATLGIQVFEYTPLQVKQIITGNGRADKKQIENFIKIEFGLSAAIKPDDAIDAAAIALSFIRNDLKVSAQYRG